MRMFKKAALAILAGFFCITVFAELPEIPQHEIDELNKLVPIHLDEKTRITTFFSDDFNALSARVEADVSGDDIQIIGDLIAANRDSIRVGVCMSPLGNLLTKKFGIFKFKYYSTSGTYMRAVIFQC